MKTEFDTYWKGRVKGNPTLAVIPIGADIHRCWEGRLTSINQRGASTATVCSPKRRDNRRRALARTSGAEMPHGQHSPTTSPACRKCMAELSRCHVKLTESNSRTVWSYKIAGTAAP